MNFVRTVLVDKAPELKGVEGEDKEEDAEEFTSKELEEIESALEEIAENKQLDIDKDELQDLKEEVNEYKEVSFGYIENCLLNTIFL